MRKFGPLQIVHSQQSQKTGSSGTTSAEDVAPLASGPVTPNFQTCVRDAVNEWIRSHYPLGPGSISALNTLNTTALTTMDTDGLETSLQNESGELPKPSSSSATGTLPMLEK